MATTKNVLDGLLRDAANCTADGERFALLRAAWQTYSDHGASAFDWDYDSRELMAALTDIPE